MNKYKVKKGRIALFIGCGLVYYVISTVLYNIPEEAIRDSQIQYLKKICLESLLYLLKKTLLYF